MNIRKNVALSETGFVFNASTGDSFSLNPIATEIVNLLKSNNTVAAIKSILLEKYDTDEATLEKDLYDFVSMLRQHQLLENE